MKRRSLMLGAMAAGLPLTGQAGPTSVVLELFTSQGCSSCPPADALLGRLEQQPGVIALSWHVDYWNGLGWHDPFASARATNRQRAYAEQLGAEVYTPALVVNGAAVVVGSDRRAIEAAMARVPALHVPVSLQAANGKLVARFPALAEPATALLAEYDPTRETAVGAGENDGRRLREYRIVRAAAMVPQAGIAAGQAEFPAMAAGRGATVLLQDARLRVIGAADLPPG